MVGRSLAISQSDTKLDGFGSFSCHQSSDTKLDVFGFLDLVLVFR